MIVRTGPPSAPSDIDHTPLGSKSDATPGHDPDGASPVRTRRVGASGGAGDVQTRGRGRGPQALVVGEEGADLLTDAERGGEMYGVEAA